ncbi:MAG: LUD domain-containing protein [Bacteroidetes bacterium]|nr:LUD domain-containing protein [Bacteroidota bacterium]
MNSRDQILSRVGQHRYDSPLPDLPSFDPPEGSVIDAFGRAVETTAGKYVNCYADEVAAHIGRIHSRADRIASTTGLVNGTVDLRDDSGSQVVGSIELFVCMAELGVAENGAVWITDSRLRSRAALFATQHLAVVVRRDSIVWNMHDAYRRITINKEGFGVFVCGPSKTADIEQSLVIGAHGPRSLTVFAIE